MMTTRLERLEAGQDRIAAAILEMQQQKQSREKGCGQRRHSLRPCFTRVRSAFVGANGHLLRRTRCWLTTRRYWAEAYLFLYASKLALLSAWLLEINTRYTDWERNAADAAECRREADWAEESARCMMECLRNGGDIVSVMCERHENFEHFPSRTLPGVRL